MQMPEATMNKNDGAIFGQDDVRATWQVLAVKSEPKTGCVQQRAHNHFGFGALALDIRHHAAAGCFVDDIHGGGGRVRLALSAADMAGHGRFVHRKSYEK